MMISGFTMARNAAKYYFPLKESIQSVLPIVDEFIVALGEGDPDDNTRAEIESIKSDKVRIFDRVWDTNLYINGRIFRHETNFALSQCKGDWCLYLQADEVVHEDDLKGIDRYCENYLDDKKVEGFLFRYFHLWGDYDHYLPHHGWYQKEIRLVRNNAGIYSRGDAQSFRVDENRRLNVIQLPANIFHYGWVRPPELMIDKKKEQDSMHWGKEEAEKQYRSIKPVFDYGPLGRLPLLPRKNPEVMKERIDQFNWKDKLNYGREYSMARGRAKHEQVKYRALTCLEQNIFGGRHIFEYSNWKLLKDNYKSSL
jgi:hypothetical protein